MVVFPLDLEQKSSLDHSITHCPAGQGSTLGCQEAPLNCKSPGAVEADTAVDPVAALRL